MAIHNILLCDGSYKFIVKRKKLNKELVTNVSVCYKLRTISQELWDIVPQINVFAYSRIYWNGDSIKLSSSSEMIRMIQPQYAEALQFDLFSLLGQRRSGFMIASEWARSLSGAAGNFYRSLITLEQDVLDVADEACLFYFRGDFVEIFHFYCDASVIDPVNFLINHQDIFKQFAIKFIHDGRCVIDHEVSKLKIDIKRLNAEKIDNLVVDKLPVLMPRKLYLDHNDLIHLTPVELKCGIEMAKGKSNQEIATKAGISVRTVEGYMSSLRKKFSCSRRNEIVQCLFQYDLGIYFD